MGAETAQKAIDAILADSGIETAREQAFLTALLWGADAGLTVWDEWAKSQGMTLPEDLRRRWRQVWG